MTDAPGSFLGKAQLELSELELAVLLHAVDAEREVVKQAMEGDPDSMPRGMMALVLESLTATLMEALDIAGTEGERRRGVRHPDCYCHDDYLGRTDTSKCSLHGPPPRVLTDYQRYLLEPGSTEHTCKVCGLREVITYPGTMRHDLDVAWFAASGETLPELGLCRDGGQHKWTRPVEVDADGPPPVP